MKAKKFQLERFQETIWSDRQNYYSPDIRKTINGSFVIEGEGKRISFSNIGLLQSLAKLINHVAKDEKLRDSHNKRN